MSKKFALIGENIQYSLSPKIHKAVFDYYGIDADYELIDIKQGGLENTIQKLKSLDGFNITKPYKTEIIKYLDGLVSKDLDAVNTAVNINGKWIGHNTDIYGFKKHITEIHDLKGKEVLVLGAGGVSYSVVEVLIELGAKIFIWNIIPDMAQELVNKYGISLVADKSKKSYYAVINCTSFGLNKGEDIGQDIDFKDTVLAYDVIYFDTDFLKTARQNAVRYSDNGLKMLIYQAISADELFLNKQFDNTDKLVKIIQEELMQ